MTPTETDLRAVYRERVHADVVELERRLIRTLETRDDVPVGPATRRAAPRRTGWSVAAAVVAAAVVVAVALGLASGPWSRTDRQRAGAVPPASADLAWTAHITPPAGYHLTLRSTTVGRQLLGLSLDGAPTSTCDCFEDRTTTLVTVFPRGGFHLATLAHRTPTTVSGRTAYFGTVTSLRIDAMSNLSNDSLRTLAWQYAPGAWAEVIGRTPPTSTAARLRSVAAALRVGQPQKIRVPLRLGPGTSGLGVLSLTQFVHPEVGTPNTTVVLSNVPTYGGPSNARALLLQFYPDGIGKDHIGPESIVGIANDPSRSITAGGRTGRISTDLATSRSPQAHFVIGHAAVYFSGQGVRGRQFRTVVSGTTWPTDPGRGDRSWFDASTLLDG